MADDEIGGGRRPPPIDALTDPQSKQLLADAEQLWGQDGMPG